MASNIGSQRCYLRHWQGSRLSHCMAITEFNEFASRLEIDKSKSGRYFIYRDVYGHSFNSYTLNQIVNQFSKCISDEKKLLSFHVKVENRRLAKRKLGIEVREGLKIIKNLNKYQGDRTLICRIKKIFGNIIFSIIHCCPSKKGTLKKIRDQYPDIKTIAVRVLTSASNYCSKNFIQKDNEKKRQVLDIIERRFYSNNWLLSEALEEPKVQSVLSRFPFEKSILFEYAKKNHINGFLDQHILSIFKNLFNGFDHHEGVASGLIPMIEQSLEKENLSLKEVFDRPYSFHRILFSKHSFLKEYFINYANENNYHEFINSYLDSVWQSDINTFKETIEKDGFSLVEIFENSGNFPSLFQNPARVTYLLEYAQENHWVHFLDSHLENLSMRVDNNLKHHFIFYDDPHIVSRIIETELQKEGRSLAEILGNFDFFQKLVRQSVFDTPSFISAIVSYARKNKLNEFLDAQLLYLYKEIAANSDQPFFDPEKTFNDNGRCLSEILENPKYVKRKDFQKLVFEGRWQLSMLSLARKNNLMNFLDDHLRFCFKQILDGFPSMTKSKICSYLDSELKNKGRFLNEVLKHPTIFNEVAPIYFTKITPYFHEAIIVFSKQNCFNGIVDGYIELIFQDIINSIDVLKNQGASLEFVIHKMLSKFDLCIEEVFLSPKILSNSKKSSQIFQNADLRRALVRYAKANNKNQFLREHLRFLCHKVTADSVYLSMNSVESLKNALEQEFREEERLFNEVLNDFYFCFILALRENFRQVLMSYCSSSPSPQENTQQDFAKIHINNAEKLGKEHARNGGHLITRLKLQNSLTNMATLKKATWNFLRENHPDHNPNTNLDLVKDATELLELINQGNYKIYNEAYKKAKANLF